MLLSRLSRVSELKKENPHLELATALNFSFLDNPTVDKLGHWLLRLVHGKNRDQFINLEGHLYKMRLEKLAQASDPQTKRANQFKILERFYSSVGYPLTERYDEKEKKYYVNIPFEDAVSLMATHKVLIRQGFANIEEKFYSQLIRLLYMRNLRVAW